MIRRSALKNHKPMKKVGARTKNWLRVRRVVMAELKAKAINSCEFGFEGCTPFSSATLAHSRKRRFCKTDADLAEVAVACIPCHRVLDEQMSHEEMYQTVRRVIENR